jgi:hypothetical protein
MKFPLWLLRLLPMWEYICPKCRKTVKANSHHCPHCGERFPQAIRIPPTILKDAKKLEDYVRKNVFPRISKFQRNCLARCFVKSDDTPSRKQVNLKKTKFLNDLHLKGKKVYICPKCKKQVPHKSHKCVFCGEKYPFAVRVPLKLLKNVRNGIATKELHDYVHIYLFPQFDILTQKYLNRHFTVTRVQGPTTGEGGSSYGITLGSVPTSGDLLILIAASYNGELTSISQGNVTWTAIKQQAGSTGLVGHAEVWQGVVGSGASKSITVNTNSSYSGAIVCEYSGLQTSSNIDASNGANGNSGTANAGSITTSGSGDLIVVAVDTYGSDTFSSVTNGSIISSFTYENGCCMVEWIGAPSGSCSAAVTLGSSDYWAAAIVAFLPTSGSTNVNLTDSGSGSDSISVQALIPLSDSGLGVEVTQPTIIFQDNFSDGNYSKWASYGNTQVSSLNPYPGTSYASRALGSAGNCYVNTNTFGPYNTISCRIYVYFEQYPTTTADNKPDNNIFFVSGDSTQYIATFGLYQNSAETGYIWSGARYGGTGSGWGSTYNQNLQSSMQTNPSLNTWYCLEMYLVNCGTTNASLYFYVNGSELTDIRQTNVNMSGAEGVGYMEIQDSWYIYDTAEVVIATSYIGPIGYAQNLVQASVSVSDSGAGADTLSVSGSSPSVNVSDSGLGSDALSSVNVRVPLADSGSGADSAIIGSSVNVPDSGLGSDALSSIIAQILAADSGLGTDSLVLGSPVNLSDSGSGSDALVIQAQIVLTDAGAGLDSAIVKVSTTISDVGLGSDVLTVSVPISISDAGLGTDTVNVVIVGALPTHAIIIQAEKGAIKLQTEKGTVTLQSDSD